MALQIKEIRRQLEPGGARHVTARDDMSDKNQAGQQALMAWWDFSPILFKLLSYQYTPRPLVDRSTTKMAKKGSLRSKKS